MSNSLYNLLNPPGEVTPSSRVNVAFGLRASYLKVSSPTGNMPGLSNFNPACWVAILASRFIGVHVFPYFWVLCNPTWVTPQSNPFTDKKNEPILATSTNALSVEATIPPRTRPSSIGNPNPHFCGSPFVIFLRCIPLRMYGDFIKLNWFAESSFRLNLWYISSKNDGDCRFSIILPILVYESIYLLPSGEYLCVSPVGSPTLYLPYPAWNDIPLFALPNWLNKEFVLSNDVCDGSTPTNVELFFGCW